MRAFLSDVDPLCLTFHHPAREKAPAGSLDALYDQIRAALTDAFAVELRGDEIWIGIVDNRNAGYVGERLSRAGEALGMITNRYEYRHAGALSCLVVKP